MATTAKKLNCFNPEHRGECQNKLLMDHENGERLTVEVRSAEMTVDHYCGKRAYSPDHEVVNTFIWTFLQK